MFELPLPSLAEIIQFLRLYYNEYGYIFVFVAAWLENIILVSVVWPGGVVVLLGAIYSRAGDLALPLVILFAWVGSLLGTLVNYLLGRYSNVFDRNGFAAVALAHLTRLPPVRWLLRRLYPAARGDEFNFARRQIERALAASAEQIVSHGAPLLLASQVAGHARCAIAVAAGAARYPLGRFLAVEAVGTFFANLLVGLIGYVVGENLDLISQLLSRINAGLIVTIVALWFLRRRVANVARWVFRRPRRTAYPPPGPESSSITRSNAE